MVNPGDVIPADGLCLEADELQCDEATMTGESSLVSKNPISNPFMLFVPYFFYVYNFLFTSSFLFFFSSSSPPFFFFPSSSFFLRCETRVQTGTGRMLVTAVGMNTQYGILKAAVNTASEEQPQTLLQIRLEKVAKCMGMYIVMCIFVIFIICYV
jgi:Ca2+-transporting ATPase